MTYCKLSCDNGDPLPLLQVKIKQDTCQFVKKPPIRLVLSGYLFAIDVLRYSVNDGRAVAFGAACTTAKHFTAQWAHHGESRIELPAVDLFL
ncbi:hypothetical protein [Gibbsiella dentisursi]|uniref:hypothetical protein n=1 Tax=Gibbsiella dentisursi TaxID=796890 RepID=UPI0031FA1073